MLHLIPNSVRFGDDHWDDAATIAVERSAARAAEEWSHAGPYCVFADAPEQRILIRVVRRPAGGPLGLGLVSPRPGELRTLTFDAAAYPSGAAPRRIRADCVVLDSRSAAASTGGDALTFTTTLLAISPDGAADPIVIEPL